MADIRKSLGKIFLVVGILLTIVGGGFWYNSVFINNLLILGSVMLVIGISILVVGIVLLILVRRKG